MLKQSCENDLKASVSDGLIPGVSYGLIPGVSYGPIPGVSYGPIPGVSDGLILSVSNASETLTSEVTKENHNNIDKDVEDKTVVVTGQQTKSVQPKPSPQSVNPFLDSMETSGQQVPQFIQPLNQVENVINTPFSIGTLVKSNKTNKTEVVVADGGDVEVVVPLTGEIMPPRGMNFSLKLLRKIFQVSDTEEGEVVKVFYLIMVIVHKLNGDMLYFKDTVESNKVKSIDWVKKCTHSLAILPVGKEEKAMYESWVQACIETENVPKEIIYPTAGWRLVEGLGYRFVYAGGIVGTDNPLIHTAGTLNTLELDHQKLHSKKVFMEAMQMGTICKNAFASAELLLFVHASVLSTFYNLVGHPINFVFGVVGITNSRKTSLATAMAQIFDRQNLKAHAEFATSTSGGVEKILGMYKDGIAIVDDFKPGITTSQTKKMSETLDKLVRFVGNGVSAKRMLDFIYAGDEKYFPITSSCVVTMELVKGVTSSISRMFLTEIHKNSVNDNLLKYYQDNKWLLPTHLYSFITWVTANCESVCAYLKNRFPELRQCHKFAYGRYSEMFATLMTSAELIGRYAREIGFWDEAYIAEFLKKTEDMLVAELAQMGENAQKRDKTDVIRRALQDAILHEKIRFVTYDRESAAKKVDAYNDQLHFYVRGGYLSKIINNFCSEFSEGVNIDKDELIDLLEKMELIDIKVNKNGRERARKLPNQNENNLRYLYLKRDAVDSLFWE